MNSELMEALDVLEKEKKISKEVLIEAIENSLLTACKSNYGKFRHFKGTVYTIIALAGVWCISLLFRRDAVPRD